MLVVSAEIRVGGEMPGEPVARRRVTGRSGRTADGDDLGDDGSSAVAAQHDADSVPRDAGPRCSDHRGPVTLSKDVRPGSDRRRRSMRQFGRGGVATVV